MYQVVDLVKVVCAKVRYDADFNFEREGEDEACFREFRYVLKIHYEN